MAANLTLQYYKAEEVYRKARTTPEKIDALLEMLRVIPKHKGTDHLQGALKAKLRETRQAYAQELKTPKGGRSSKLPRQGCATVVVIGGPNSGKSQLVASLSNAAPKVAPYPYTTQEPTTGMVDFDGVRIQFVDTPPVAGNLVEPYLVDFVRTADLVLCCFDGSSDDAPSETIDVFNALAERKTILSPRSGFDSDDYSIVHVKSRFVVTRGQDADAVLRLELLQELQTVKYPVTQLDLLDETACSALVSDVFNDLSLIRIFTKRPGEEVELVDPYTLDVGGTVEDLAFKVHEEIAQQLKFARIWRDGQCEALTVGRGYGLQDLDVVELHI